MQKIFSILTLAIMLVLGLSAVSPVLSLNSFAQETDPCKVSGNTGPGCNRGVLEIIGISNDDLTTGDAIVKSISNIARWIISFVVVLCVVYLILGAFKMVRDGGDGKLYKEGLDAVKFAVIGLIICLLSFAIVTAIQSVFVSGNKQN